MSNCIYTRKTFFPYFISVKNYFQILSWTLSTSYEVLAAPKEAITKEISAVEGKPFTSSLNIYTEAQRGGRWWSNVFSPPPRLYPISQMIRGKDDVTVILLLDVFFMEAIQSIQQFSYVPVCFKLRHDYRKPIQHNAHMKACTVQ
jgi:hypothetical protein